MLKLVVTLFVILLLARAEFAAAAAEAVSFNKEVEEIEPAVCNKMPMINQTAANKTIPPYVTKGNNTVEQVKQGQKGGNSGIN